MFQMSIAFFTLTCPVMSSVTPRSAIIYFTGKIWQGYQTPLEFWKSAEYSFGDNRGTMDRPSGARYRYTPVGRGLRSRDLRSTVDLDLMRSYAYLNAYQWERLDGPVIFFFFFVLARMVEKFLGKNFAVLKCRYFDFFYPGDIICYLTWNVLY